MERDEPYRVPGGRWATWLGIIAMVVIFIGSIIVAARSEPAVERAGAL